MLSLLITVFLLAFKFNHAWQVTKRHGTCTFNFGTHARCSKWGHFAGPPTKGCSWLNNWSKVVETGSLYILESGPFIQEVFHNIWRGPPCGKTPTWDAILKLTVVVAMMQLNWTFITWWSICWHKINIHARNHKTKYIRSLLLCGGTIGPGAGPNLDTYNIKMEL